MGSFGHGLLVFVLGALAIIIGGYMISRPGMALGTLTLVLAVYFAVDGVFQILWAFRLRPIKGWGWALFSGIVSLALGVMIWRQFPVSGVWAVGTLAGIQMVFGGSVCGIGLRCRTWRRQGRLSIAEQRSALSGVAMIQSSHASSR